MHIQSKDIRKRRRKAVRYPPLLPPPKIHGEFEVGVRCVGEGLHVPRASSSRIFMALYARVLARNVIVEGAVRASALDSPLEHLNRNWILTGFLGGRWRGGVRRGVWQPLRRAP